MVGSHVHIYTLAAPLYMQRMWQSFLSCSLAGTGNRYLYNPMDFSGVDAHSFKRKSETCEPQVAWELN